jgi:peptidoglycan/xylan/chitin deacetylase (PgdA/CDA1 family)
MDLGVEPDGSSVVALRRPTTSTVLTYDDGPTPGVTDRLLPVLAEAGATATFFVLLTRVRAHLGLLHEVLAAGHEIGLHGLDHLRLTTLPAETLPTRFRDAKAELEDLAAVPLRWSRPAYGAQDLASWRATRDAGLEPVLWSVACQDWRRIQRRSTWPSCAPPIRPAAWSCCTTATPTSATVSTTDPHRSSIGSH